mmetsp:Transcript_2767/g.7707  ORF Transcript_2767/g.7707 Transcript_2767/m.7707 type:complete len:249 (-) Transcript_2767:293-1039(-)
MAYGASITIGAIRLYPGSYDSRLTHLRTTAQNLTVTGWGCLLSLYRYCVSVRSHLRYSEDTQCTRVDATCTSMQGHIGQGTAPNEIQLSSGSRRHTLRHPHRSLAARLLLPQGTPMLWPAAPTRPKSSQSSAAPAALPSCLPPALLCRRCVSQRSVTTMSAWSSRGCGPWGGVVATQARRAASGSAERGRAAVHLPTRGSAASTAEAELQDVKFWRAMSAAPSSLPHAVRRSADPSPWSLPTLLQQQR